MSPHPHAAAARLHRLRQRLGPDARCLTCGTADPTVLMTPSRAFFERHHLLGKAHAPDLTVLVCRNCHAILSAHQGDDAVPLGPQSTLLERLAAILQALITFLKDLAEFLLALALRLVQFITGLDTHAPTWRNQPWAR